MLVVTATSLLSCSFNMPITDILITASCSKTHMTSAGSIYARDNSLEPASQTVKNATYLMLQLLSVLLV